MHFPGSGPGKTAPKLLHDFLAFDPLKASNTAKSLPDITPPVGEGPLLVPNRASCKHEYRTKSTQSLTPPPDLRPDERTEYKVAAICGKCRIHAEVHIGFAYASNVCPNSDCPLHHFHRLPSADTTTESRMSYTWQCSAPECCATLTTTYRLPRLDDKTDKHLLTNTDLLKRRYGAVVEDDPQRDGVRQATPLDALTRLRRYIGDSLKPDHLKQTFPANNKRFMEAFGVNGQDCKPLLNRLGFTDLVDPETGTLMWKLPQPPALGDRLRTEGSSQREYLEDVEAELLAWIHRLANDMNVPNPAAGETWPNADRDFERTLAVQGYLRYPSPRRNTAIPDDETQYFASLGILPDFADALVEFAFDRQIACHPEQSAYYFECLQVIAEQRNTERLQIKVATLSSQDLISRRDLSAAYRHLNISAQDAQGADDDRILSLFQVRQSDLGASAQEDARQALYKIGVSRRSQRLINASRQILETYEDALVWIGNGVNKDTTDEGLLAVVAMRASESKDGDDMPQKAISVIAKERKSNTLNEWLLTGRSDGYSMTPDEALRHLGYSDNFATIESEMLPLLYESARSDRPGEQTERAIATLQKAASEVPSTARSPETWPVGLTSHGNTCYLNSLLQYYFSIVPLRDIVLNYDRYKLDTSQYEQKTERVGQRNISMVEIKGGQRFAEDLKHLFDRMIKDPREHVKPEEDLVCRAFLEPKDYALLASAIREEKAAQIPQINGVDNSSDEKPTDSATAAVVEEDTRNSDASSATLQASPINGDPSMEAFQDSSATGQSTDTPMGNGETPLTPPASPGNEAFVSKEKPTTAPPLPPRRFSVTKEEALRKAQDNAKQQQDVTEVHDSIMFRLRSGMMPQGKDASEEQEDALRDLFKINLVETTVKDGEDEKQKELFDSSIQLNVPAVDTDIYSALDAVFDLQAYDENSNESSFETYKSIRSLPPLLQINIPRIGFLAKKDGKGGEAYKSDKCVKLEEVIYLDRYVDTMDASVLPKRKACWGWRKQLHALRKEQKALSSTMTELDGPSAVIETSRYLTALPDINKELEAIGVDSIDFNPQLSSVLDTDATELKSRMDALQLKIGQVEDDLQGHFLELKQLKYRLAAVFFHRGSHGHGHYWIYIRDFEKNMWRSYNDERVEEFTKINEILQANNHWQHGTPTYAVYVKDDKSNFIAPVCRQPEKLPTPEPTDNNNSAWQPNDVKMSNGDSQNDHIPTTFDPKLSIVAEGGEEAWDEQRQVPDGVMWFERDASRLLLGAIEAGECFPKRRIHDFRGGSEGNGWGFDGVAKYRKMSCDSTMGVYELSLETEASAEEEAFFFSVIEFGEEEE